MKVFGKCLRENLSSPLTYAAMILLFVLCGAGVTVSINDTTYSFFEIIFNSELLSQAKDMSECASYLMAYSFANSAYYTIGLAIITAVPALYTYIRSFEKIQIYAMIRSDYKAYSAGIVLSSFFSGAIITLAGIFLYTAAAYLIFPGSASFEDPYFLMAYGETVFARLFLFIKRVCNHALVGGIIPVFAITLYRYILSDFFAATIPMMLMYVSVKVLPNLREWLNSDISRSENAFAKLFVISFPSNLSELVLSLERTFNAPFWLAYIILSAFLCVLYLLFYRSVKRV